MTTDDEHLRRAGVRAFKAFVHSYQGIRPAPLCAVLFGIHWASEVYLSPLVHTARADGPVSTSTSLVFWRAWQLAHHDTTWAHMQRQ